MLLVSSLDVSETLLHHQVTRIPKKKWQWQYCSQLKSEQQYPLVIKHGNGKSPMNGGLNRRITKKKWSKFSIAMFDCHRVAPPRSSRSKKMACLRWNGNWQTFAVHNLPGLNLDSPSPPVKRARAWEPRSVRREHWLMCRPGDECRSNSPPLDLVQNYVKRSLPLKVDTLR